MFIFKKTYVHSNLKCRDFTRCEAPAVHVPFTIYQTCMVRVSEIFLVVNKDLSITSDLEF